MTYELEVVEHLHKLFKKMAKREKYVLDAIEDKVREIREDPIITNRSAHLCRI